jgi:plastocyanin
VLALVAAAAGGGTAAASAAMDGMHGGAMPAADATHVSIGFDSFAPPRVDVLAGDSVTWANDSVRAHTVTATDGSWDSQRLGAGEAYTHSFDVPGTVAYYCSLHPFMRGEVDAHELLLDQPGGPAGPGRSFPIAGRAALPSGTAVAVERDEGSGFARAATATVGPDGRFTATVRPRTTARYRAVAGNEASPPVQLLVLDHRVGVSVTPGARRVVVATSVTPASPGSSVVLQLHLRDRFGWWPVQRARLDRASRARFVVRLRHRVPARVLLTLPDGATALATSRAVRIGPAAPGRRPRRS